jgi:hypothetical protein
MNESGMFPRATVGVLGDPGLVGEDVREARGRSTDSCPAGLTLGLAASSGSGPTGGGGRASIGPLEGGPLEGGPVEGSTTGMFNFQRPEPGVGAGAGSEPIQAVVDV